MKKCILLEKSRNSEKLMNKIKKREFQSCKICEKYKECLAEILNLEKDYKDKKNEKN